MQYVLTLDSDTRLPRDSARKLIGKLAHPLNAPTIDPVTKRVTEGYGILQPRITPSLTTGDEASIFQRIFSRDRGLDPYVFAVSDVYQDLFGEGSFTGKGLYHVDAFHTALEGRIAENTILSHDLLEGALREARWSPMSCSSRISRFNTASRRRASIAGCVATGSCCRISWGGRGGRRRCRASR